MIAIYARQSVENKDSISIETQIETCAKKVNREVAECKVYKDEGYSGSNTNRPEFEAMMRDIKSGLIDVVVVYKLDRISRSLLDFMQIQEELDKYKVEFISCSEQFDTSTAMGRAMLNIMMVFAQLERETIQKRITDNYYDRGKKGFYLGGRPPFGFKKVKTEHQGKKTCKYAPVEEQIEVVKMMFDEYANNESSFGQLVKTLNSEGGIKTINGNCWSSVQVGRIIKNPAFVKANADVYLYYKNRGATMNNDVTDYNGEKGLYLYAKRKDETKTKFTDVSKSFITLGLHEGIIDADTFLRCQYKSDKNQILKNSGKGKHSWLSGILKCGYCGYAITVVNGNKNWYINCGGRRRYECFGRQKVVYIWDIENIVEPKLLEKLQTLKVRNVSNNNKRERKMDELKGRMVFIEEKIEKLVDSLVDMTEGSAKYVDKRIQDLDRQKLSIQSEMNELLREETMNKVSITDLQEYIDNWSSYDLEQKKTVAKAVIEKVRVTDDEIFIDFKL